MAPKFSDKDLENLSKTVEKHGNLGNKISFITGLVALGISICGYVFETRHNTKEIEAIKEQAARKDVVVEQISSLKAEMVAIKEQIKENTKAAIQAYERSSANNELLTKILIKEGR